MGDYKIDYQVHLHRDFEGTNYTEIGPGKFSGKYWQPGFIFISEDAFRMAGGIVARNVKEYDPWAHFDIHKRTGIGLITEWKTASSYVRTQPIDELWRTLGLYAPNDIALEHDKKEVNDHRTEIARMFTDLATETSRFLEQAEWICIIGI